MRTKPLTPKGFTLMELLIVIFIMAILAVGGITAVIRSQAQFKFRGAIKETSNIIREVRSHALSNTLVDEEVPLQYGVYIDPVANEIKIFADKYSDELAKENIFDDSDHIFRTYTLPEEYKYMLYMAETPDPTQAKLTAFYQPTTANFTTVAPFDTERYSAIHLYEGEDEATATRDQYIVLFKGAGNPESFNELDF